MVRTFGAGEGGNREWTQMDANGDGRRGQGNGLSADDADYRRWGEGNGGWAMADFAAPTEGMFPPRQRRIMRKIRAAPWEIVPKYKEALKGRPRQPSHPHALPNRTSPLMKLPGAR